MSRDRLTDIWDPGPGGMLAVETPFHLGLLRAGAHLSRFQGRTDVPDFSALYAFLGWGLESKLPLGFTGLGSFDAGVFGMRFPREGNANEFEMGVGLSARVRRPIGSAWAVEASAGLRRILTARPINQRVISAGLVRTFGSPPWVADALSGHPPEEPIEDFEHGPETSARGELPAQRTLRRGEIQRAGLQRLSGVFRLLDRWAGTTLDELTWQASPAGLSPFEIQAWRVMVDGREVSLDLLGVQSLDRLPFALAQVDSVQILAGPGIHHGVPTDQGLLHFHTASPAPGLSFVGSIHGGNPTGDPGPFELVDPGARNVDKLGSGALLSVAYGADRFRVRVGWTGLWYSISDPAVWDRNISMWDDPVKRRIPSVKIDAPSLELELDADGSRHRMSLSGSRAVDFFFLPQFGREVTTLEHLRHAAVWGEFDLAGNKGLEYRLTYSENQLSHHRNRVDLDLDWRLRRWGAQIDVKGWGWRSSGTVGVGLEGRAGGTGYALSDTSDLLLNAYARTRLGAGHGAPEAIASLTLGRETRLGARLGLVGDWEVGGGRRVRVAAGYARRRPEESPGLWTWRERGYGFLEDRGISVLQEGDLRASWQATLDARLDVPVGGRLNVSASGYLRRTGGLALGEQTFDFSVSRIPESSPELLLATDAGGDVAGLELEVRARIQTALELRSYYGFRTTIGNDALFRRAWSAVPEHRARQVVEYVPADDLSLRAQLEYRGGTAWSAYPIPNPGGPRDTPGVPASVTVDLSVQKWLWGGRLRTVALARDVLDHDVGFHPIGASPGRSLLVQASVFLPRDL